MKKPTTYIACLLVLVSTGCDKTVLEFPENGGVDPTLVNMNLTLAIDPKIEPYEPTGRSEAPEADTHDVRWIVEVFRDEIGGEPVEQQVLSCEQAADGHHAIRTSLAVHAARYHVVAWMDYVDDGSTADKYYHVNSLSSISVPEAGDYIGNEDHKDAYIAQQEIDLKDYRDRWNATADATVTLCHRKTPDLAARCRDADILLAAAGAPGLITTDFVRPGQIVLDAGATALPDGTLRGDVAPDAAAIAVCTPVPGGIGSVTTALLLRHTVQAAENLRHF
mgnify:CR=1 FL=1